MSNSNYVMVVKAVMNFMAAAIFSIGCAVAANWSYEGKTGPAHWGRLDPKYVTCELGKAQSPIDITKKALEHGTQQQVIFQYQPASLDLQLNKYNLYDNISPGKGGNVSLGKVTYNLQGFHFHNPGEHRIDGKRYPMELHMVHQNAQKDYLVVSVMLAPGKTNAALKEIFSHLPKQGQEITVTSINLDANAFLPKDKDYYQYTGSLTTPPCTERVIWILLKHPITASPEQMAFFKHHVLSMNARPVQPLNHRKVLEKKKLLVDARVMSGH